MSADTDTEMTMRNDGPVVGTMASTNTTESTFSTEQSKRVDNVIVSNSTSSQLSSTDNSLQTTPTIRCRLLELPVELQDQIFELALVIPGTIDINLSHTTNDEVGVGFEAFEAVSHHFRKNNTNNRRQPALSMTCNAIREQVLKIFYKQNWFTAY